MQYIEEISTLNIVGLVAEYNPFHNGHLYHIKKAKEITGADFIIVVMSGNYVQRGEPAFCDKYLRTSMALLNGASLVIEIPVMYATSSAEYFARAAVSLLESTGIVNSICFGSECGDIDSLTKIADVLVEEPPLYKSILKKHLDEGMSFPNARALAISHFTSLDKDILNNPNNILGIEYLKSLKILKSKMKPFTIAREISSYNSIDIENEISSATAIRHYSKKNDFNSIAKTMPQNAFDIFVNSINNNDAPILFNNFSNIFHYIIKSYKNKQLMNILDVTEGLENRIVNCSNETFLISDIIDLIKTKRYTYTKIQRALLHILLDIKKNDLETFNKNGGPQYLRVLGFNKKCQCLLKEIEENALLPIITNLKYANKNLSELQLSMLNKELQSTDLYYLGLTPYKATPKNIEYKKPLVIL